MTIGLAGLLTCSTGCFAFKEVPHDDLIMCERLDFKSFNYTIVDLGYNDAEEMYNGVDSNEAVEEFREEINNININGSVYESFDELRDLAIIEKLVGNATERPCTLKDWRFVNKPRFPKSIEIKRKFQDILDYYDDFSEQQNDAGSHVSGSYNGQ